jgi:hypothetical protein
VVSTLLGWDPPGRPTRSPIAGSPSSIAISRARRADRQHPGRRRVGGGGDRAAPVAARRLLHAQSRGPDAAERLLARARRLAAARVCLFPAMHHYRWTDERVSGDRSRPPPSRARRCSSHCGVLTVGVRKRLGLASPFNLRLGDPLALATVAARFPKVPVIISALRRRLPARER